MLESNFGQGNLSICLLFLIVTMKNLAALVQIFTVLLRSRTIAVKHRTDLVKHRTNLVKDRTDLVKIAPLR